MLVRSCVRRTKTVLVICFLSCCSQQPVKQLFDWSLFTPSTFLRRVSPLQHWCDCAHILIIFLLFKWAEEEFTLSNPNITQMVYFSKMCSYTWLPRFRLKHLRKILWRITVTVMTRWLFCAINDHFLDFLWARSHWFILQVCCDSWATQGLGWQMSSLSLEY